MHFGTHEQLVLLALLAAILLLLIAAPVFRIPYPIFLVLGGLALGFVPGIPEITLPPDVVLVAVLPPLLYSAAFFTSIRDLRQNARTISLLSIGLVIATTCAVAIVAHEWIDGFSWAAAFVLGAVVSPTDPLAATEIARRLGVPHRPVAIIEGESLVNDGTALVLYKVAVGAVVAGTFSYWDTFGRFAWAVAGGVAIGLGIGFVIAEVRRRLDNPPLEVTIALLSGYFAFIPANAAGASGVLAVVTAGVYMGWRTPELTSVQTRLQGNGVWEILTFVINALLFALVGLQLPHIVDALGGTSHGTLVTDALIVIAAVVLTRLLWIPIPAYLPRWLSPRLRERDPYPPFWSPLVIGWSGMRGAVTGRRTGRAAHHGLRQRLRPARPDRLPDVLRDPVHARLPGPDIADGDPRLRSRARRRRRARGVEGASPCSTRGARPARRADRGRRRARGHRRAAPRCLPFP